LSNTATILIVDDVPTNIQVLAGFLKKHYQLKAATNGKQALKIIKQQLPDLILLDIEMPEMNGYEVCQTLKDNPETQNIPIIFVTANNQEEDEEKGLQLGAVDYITKPIRPSIVTARVKTQITLKQQYDKLRNMAIKDQLTDLYNRHYLFEAAQQRIANAIRHNHALCLLMLDIDHFKRINDQHGHPTGDVVLVAMADLLKKQCRSEDIIARFGGEEFVILLDQTDIQSAQNKAEKLRHLLEQLKPEQINISASFGIAQFSENESIDDLIKRSDTALYQAKENGRNQVVCA